MSISDDDFADAMKAWRRYEDAKANSPWANVGWRDLPPELRERLAAIYKRLVLPLAELTGDMRLANEMALEILREEDQ